MEFLPTDVAVMHSGVFTNVKKATLAPNADAEQSSGEPASSFRHVNMINTCLLRLPTQMAHKHGVIHFIHTTSHRRERLLFPVLTLTSLNLMGENCFGEAPTKCYSQRQVGRIATEFIFISPDQMENEA